MGKCWALLALAVKVVRKSLDLILRAVESCESILRRKVKGSVWGMKNLLFKKLRHAWI